MTIPRANPFEATSYEMTKIPDLEMSPNIELDTEIQYTDVESYLKSDWVKVQRCGVIPYTYVNGKRLFCMGLDSESGDITDFSGRTDPRRDKTPISTALREFREETLNVFTSISVSDIGQSLVIHDPDNLIVLIHCDLDPDQVDKIYALAHERAMIKREEKMQAARERPNLSACHWLRCSRLPEISKFVWLDADDLSRLINETRPPKSGRSFFDKRSPPMFSRVRNFLRRCVSQDITL